MARSWKLKRPRRPTARWRCPDPECNKVMSVRGRPGHLKLAHKVDSVEELIKQITGRKLKKIERYLSIKKGLQYDVDINILRDNFAWKFEGFKYPEEIPELDEYRVGRYRLVRYMGWRYKVEEPQ